MKYKYGEPNFKTAFHNWLLQMTMKIIGAKNYRITYKKGKR